MESNLNNAAKGKTLHGGMSFLQTSLWLPISNKPNSFIVIFRMDIHFYSFSTGLQNIRRLGSGASDPSGFFGAKPDAFIMLAGFKQKSLYELLYFSLVVVTSQDSLFFILLLSFRTAVAVQMCSSSLSFTFSISPGSPENFHGPSQTGISSVYQAVHSRPRTHNGCQISIRVPSSPTDEAKFLSSGPKRPSSSSVAMDVRISPLQRTFTSKGPLLHPCLSARCKFRCW